MVDILHNGQKESLFSVLKIIVVRFPFVSFDGKRAVFFVHIRYWPRCIWQYNLSVLWKTNLNLWNGTISISFMSEINYNNVAYEVSPDSKRCNSQQEVKRCFEIRWSVFHWQDLLEVCRIQTSSVGKEQSDSVELRSTFFRYKNNCIRSIWIWKGSYDYF